MSAKYKEFSGLNLPALEKEVLQQWEENNAFENSVSEREGATPFVFYEGPPSANGMPGIHHVISRTLKDLVCRYKTMQGFQVKRKGGWDTHGLPVELGVEKELGITKEDIGKKISVEEYNQKCREAVLRYKHKWDELTKKMGYWVDLNEPYITFENNYIETLWWILKQLYDKNLLYESVSIQPYSPAAGTGLSSHELNQPGCYKEVKDTSCVAMFKAVENEQNEFLFKAITSQDLNEIFFLAWTTTPWTLPSNLGLTVGSNIEYVLVEDYINEYTKQKSNVILAQKRLKSTLGLNKYRKWLLEQVINVKPNQQENSLIHGFLVEKDNTTPVFLVDLIDNITSTNIIDILTSENFNECIIYRDFDSNTIDIDRIHDNFKRKNINVIIKDVPAILNAKKLIFKGADLEGISYEQLMPFEANKINNLNSFKILLGDFVTTEDGTGIVHTAPAFGADDFKVGKKYDIGILTMVDRQGKFIDGLGEFSNRYVKNYKDEKDYVDVNVDICVKLKKENRAFKIEKYEHSYPHCWRTDKPILYYPLDAWFIRTTALKDRMVELNKTINWKPKSTGEGRFGNWLENMVDWNLSRSRFWGTPLPVWRTEDRSEEICIGSVDELNKGIKKANAVLGNDVNKDYLHEGILDLHKPFVDEIILVSESGKAMTRVPDLVDVWFDSGAMPYAQWHYPFENKDLIDKNAFPADFIAEGVDQTRGWFYTLHALGVLLFDSVAYKTCVSNGLVLDKNGNKMSKRLGNIVDPFKTIETFGADATRWYLITNASPWDNLKFDLAGIQEVQRKFFGTLYNTYQFFALYANVDGFAFKEAYIPLSERPEIDRWILSSLNTLIKEATTAMDDYEPTQAGRFIEEFLDEHLSNWYVRLCRRRFWKGEYEHDKICAYQTLYECLETLTRLIAPISPFFSDAVFKNLEAITNKMNAASVHHTEFPKAKEDVIDILLEERMQLAQDISSLALSIRKKEKIKVRQPLQKIQVPLQSSDLRLIQSESIKEIIKQEINLKEIEVVDINEFHFTKSIKPNYKALGGKLGKAMKNVAKAIESWTQNEIRFLEQTKQYNFHISLESNEVLSNTNNNEGRDVETFLDEYEITIQDIPGWSVASKGNLTVALDITITEALQKEGEAREFINRIQNIRKESGLALTDRIQVDVSAPENIRNSLIEFKNYICAEILADDFYFVPQIDSGTEIEVNDNLLKVQVIKKDKNDGY